MYKRCRIDVLLTLLTACGGCGTPAATAPEAEASPPWFLDVTGAVGLDFLHASAPPNTSPYFMPRMTGAGGALFDFDNDGRLDVFLVQSVPAGVRPGHRLYRQRDDGTFADVTAGSGIDGPAGYGQGAAVGDVNNDGLPDLLVTEFGGARLFLNRGNGKFADVTKDAGLDNPLWATSAAFFDFDRDGRLDLIIANYLEYDPTKPCALKGGQPEFCGPSSFPGTVAKLFRNLGPVQKPGFSKEPGVWGGFEDVTLKSGLGRLSGPGLGVVCADFDGDRWPDVLVANDGKPNHLWVNQRNGTFKEEAVLRGLAFNGMGQALANMGIALGDADGDGLFDIFVTHLTEETHTLWKQGPRGQFRDHTAAGRLGGGGSRSTGFGTLLGDFDNDGDDDLAVANGRVTRAGAPANDALGPFWTWYAERNHLYANDGGKFRDLSAANGPLCGTPGMSRGLACGDLDNDGGLDLLVTATDAPARLYRNAAPDRGRWLIVRCVDPACGGRDAYGAEVTVRAGGRHGVRWLNPGYSYLCGNDPRAHFGLGGAEKVAAVEVVWPDGSEEVFPGGPAGRVLVVRKGEGQKR